MTGRFQVVEDAVMYVEDATGGRFLFTVADTSHVARFREHASWWMRHVRTPKGQEPYRKSHRAGPVFPCRVVVEEIVREGR